MQVVIRVDASESIGTGHVMRCITLGLALKQRLNAQITFICRSLKGNLISNIKKNGFQVHILNQDSIEQETKLTSTTSTKLNNYEFWLGCTQKQDAQQCLPVLNAINPDLLIVDHYAIDINWQNVIKGSYKKLLIIDDLANRSHDADILIDQNFGVDSSQYIHLVPNSCNILTGSSYALLGDEFPSLRKFSLERRLKFKLQNILISLGGADPDNYTGRILHSLERCVLPSNTTVTVILGSSSPNLLKIKEQIKELSYKVEIQCGVSNMAELIANADIGIGAAGATTWERCCLGLPSIQVVIAENQKKIAENLSRINAIKYLLNFDDLSALLTSANNWAQEVSKIAASLCDGEGVQRVVKQIDALYLK